MSCDGADCTSHKDSASSVQKANSTRAHTLSCNRVTSRIYPFPVALSPSPLNSNLKAVAADDVDEARRHLARLSHPAIVVSHRVAVAAAYSRREPLHCCRRRCQKEKSDTARRPVYDRHSLRCVQVERLVSSQAWCVCGFRGRGGC